jgi:hypothetical protein
MSDRSERKPRFAWFRKRKLDILLVTILIAITGAVSAINMTGYPQRFEDEGTYISQAWAIKERGELAHYTYWYDHPPAGWIQMAIHLAATDALDRYGSAITAGREFMLLLHLACIVLLYALARRLGIGRVGSVLAPLLYGLSPLTVEFSRYVMLDNVALPWFLAAFFLALTPRRSLGAAVGSAVCMAIAALSKETFLALVPVLLYVLWRQGDKRNRRYNLMAFSVVLGMVGTTYLVFAALKNELFPGPGHVSLIGSFLWQIIGREGGGNVFDPASYNYGLVKYWLSIDKWLLILGAASLVPALIFKNLRPAGLALLIGLGLMLRSGYLPFPYVIALLPFAALCFAGAFDRLVVRPLAGGKGLVRLAGIDTFLLVVIVSGFIVAPAWQSGLYALTHSDQDYSSRQAVSWITKNVPTDNRLIVESALWSDLETKGYDQPNPVWLYKTETDPTVKKSIGGWRGIDYIIINGPTVSDEKFDENFPTVHEAMENSKQVAEFGEDKLKIMIFEVAN